MILITFIKFVYICNLVKILMWEINGAIYQLARLSYKISAKHLFYKFIISLKLRVHMFNCIYGYAFKCK